MNIYFDGVADTDDVLMAASSYNSAETTSSTIVRDEEVPTGYEEDNCLIHYAMLLLTVAFAAYNVCRTISRAKAHIDISKTRTSID